MNIERYKEGDMYVCMCMLVCVVWYICKIKKKNKLKLKSSNDAENNIFNNSFVLYQLERWMNNRVISRWRKPKRKENWQMKKETSYYVKFILYFSFPPYNK